MSDTVLTPPPPPVEEPPLVPLPPALVLAVEVPYWELARRLSRADLNYLADTDTYVGALATAGGQGQLNWQLATGASGGDLTAVVGEDYAPLLRLDAALPMSEADALAVPVTALSQPERLGIGDYAYLVDAAGQIREAVAILAFDAGAGTVDLSRAVLDTTPQAHATGTRLIGVGEWLAGETTERAPGEIRLTSPREAALYVDAAGVDFLAVSVGTVHGRFSGEPRLDLDRLAAIGAAVGAPLVIHGGTGLSDEQLRALVARGVAKINYYTALSDLAAAAASNALANVETGYAAAIDAVRAAVADEVARTCEVFGAAGRAEETLAVCRPWRNVEHVILFNWSAQAAGRAGEFEAEGRDLLARVPGVRAATVGAAIRADAPYQRAWLIRLASAAAEAAYMNDPTHLDYANRVFRPHAADRIKGDYERE